MFSGDLFWFVMGMLMILVAVGAVTWAKELGLKMTWWKWLLAALWYGLFNVSLAAPMTVLGENEPNAALRIFIPMIVVSIVLGVGLWRLLAADRQKVAE